MLFDWSLAWVGGGLHASRCPRVPPRLSHVFASRHPAFAGSTWFLFVISLSGAEFSYAYVVAPWAAISLVWTIVAVRYRKLEYLRGAASYHLLWFGAGGAMHSFLSMSCEIVFCLAFTLKLDGHLDEVSYGDTNG